MSVRDRDSNGSSQFRETTHLIPTPGVERKRPPRYQSFFLQMWVVGAITLTMMSLAAALEATLFFSNKNNGFNVPPEKEGLFKLVPTQFLTSFFPIVFVAPLALAWIEVDFLLKWYHPYVVLSRGRATAEDGLLLDYIALGNFLAFFSSIKHKHPIVLISTITAVWAYGFQPLAGSVLQVRAVPDPINIEVTSIRAIGLNPNFANLNGFSASAGFVEAAVYNKLPDPPFIKGGWAAAQFVFPADPTINGSITLNTTGILSSPNCDLPSSFTVTPTANGKFAIFAESVNQCGVNFTVDPSMAEDQNGAISIPGCNGITDPGFQPVMFWFFRLSADNQPEARGVFCDPTIAPFNILATVNLSNGSISDVTVSNDYTTPNNVTGPPLSGAALNALFFNSSSDIFVQARSLSTSSGIPRAIYLAASGQPNGPDSVFENDLGFVTLTEQIYTQHLSLSAKAYYFVGVNESFPAVLTSLQAKLFVQPIPAHLLAFLLATIGSVGLVLHVIYKRRRRYLWLTSPPGSIAGIVSMTSRSGWGELLLPYDDEKTIEQKLKALKFRLDERTSAIVVDDDDESSSNMGPDDATMSLLGERRATASSSYYNSATSPPVEVEYFDPYQSLGLPP